MQVVQEMNSLENFPKYTEKQKAGIVGILIGSNGNFKLVKEKPEIILRKPHFCKSFLDNLIDLFGGDGVGEAFLKSTQPLSSRNKNKITLSIEFKYHPFIGDLFIATETYYKKTKRGKRLPKPLRKYFNKIVLGFWVIDSLNSWMTFDFLQKREEDFKGFYLFADTYYDQDNSFLKHILINDFNLQTSHEIYDNEYGRPRIITRISEDSIPTLISTISETLPKEIIPAVKNQRDFLIDRGWHHSSFLTVKYF